MGESNQKGIFDIHQTINESRTKQYGGEKCNGEDVNILSAKDLFKYQVNEGLYIAHVQLYSRILGLYDNLYHKFMRLREYDKRRPLLKRHLRRARLELNKVEERLHIILTERAENRKQN